MNFLAGLVAVLVGAAIAGAGLPLYTIMLQISGFVVGFLAGAAIIASAFGDGFLASTLGFVIGIAIGLVFAILAYFYWYASVLLIVGMSGFVFGASLFATIGVHPDWLLFVLALVVAAAFFMAAVLLNFPVFFIIGGTAFSGSAIVIAGLLVFFGIIERSSLSSGEVWRAIGDNPLLWLAWVAIAIAGIAVQLSMVKRVPLPGDRWTKIAP